VRVREAEPTGVDDPERDYSDLAAVGFIALCLAIALAIFVLAFLAFLYL
jgi:hypothetical protein